jgi:GNAT acetyltransferase-like protein
MSESTNNRLSFPSESLQRWAVPRIEPIDKAVQRHVSQAYWDWRTLFDRDPLASPWQHADYVLAELNGERTASELDPVLMRAGTASECSALGILVPKDIRSRQVGGIGPGWMLHGLRLAGGRFLSEHDSSESQAALLAAATRHCQAVGADFLLIEDLDEHSPLFGAVKNENAHGCKLFDSHNVQPRWRIQFPATADEYWQSFSSRSLSKFRRSLKKFGNVRLERITSLEQLPDFLRAAHEVSQQSWQSRQFGLRIRNDEAELRQMSILAQHGFLRSYLWWIEGRPAAFAVCNQHRGCFRYEEIAYCQEFAQFSPGRVMLQQIVEDLLRHDPPQTFDFGGGDAEYKRQFANRESRSGTVWLVPPTRRARVSLMYLKSCRRLRTAVRRVVQTCGMATKARQWIRRRGGASASARQSTEIDEASSGE